MATIKDFTEITPFQLELSFSSYFEASDGALSVAVENCQLCHGNKRPFYCKKCVQKGDFTKSKSDDKENYGTVTDTTSLFASSEEKIETYNERLKKLQLLIHQRKELEEKVNTRTRKYIEKNRKRNEILLARQRNEQLKKAITYTKDLLEKDTAQLKTLQTKLKSQKPQPEKREEKKKNINKYIDKCKDKIPKLHSELEKYSMMVSEVRYQHVHDLVTYVFPIEKLLPKCYKKQYNEETEEFDDQTKVDLLADARHTSYVQGRWVYVARGSELEHKIILPSLPGNGDYSIYHLCKEANKDENLVNDLGLEQNNPVFNIGAALQYTAQLVTLLSYFLNVNVPYRVMYSDFGKVLTKDKFQTLVYKLNSNVLHLCFSQKMDVEDLNPYLTLDNIIKLVSSSQLGRSGDFAVPDELMHSFEENCPNNWSETDNSEWEEDNYAYVGDVEWEEVSGNLPDVDMSYSSVYSSAQVSQRDLNSVTASQNFTAGLMSSATAAAAAVSSLWRGWGHTPSDK